MLIVSLSLCHIYSYISDYHWLAERWWMFRFYSPFRENIYTWAVNAAQRHRDEQKTQLRIECEWFEWTWIKNKTYPLWILFQSSVKEKMCSYIMGIDIGTTSVKVCLINSSNREVIHKNIKVGKFEYRALICSLLKDENYNTHFGLKRPNSCRCLNFKT